MSLIEPSQLAPPRSSRDAIHLLFEPKSIAIIGATADPTKLGSTPLTAMTMLNYEGRIYVVNPRHTELMGFPAFPSVDALPEVVDVAMIVLPADPALDVAEALVASGVRALVMIPQGFGEAGGEGVARDQRLLKLAEMGVAITGPNTNGIANVVQGVAMTIGPVFSYPGAVRPGRIGVISQSGAMISSILTKLNQCNLGVGKTATCGNELCLNVADYLEYFIDDAKTDTIVLYLETIRDMPVFRAALARARAANKPVIAIKVGESESGQKAALSHTGAIAGSYRNTIAFLESEGVYVAEDLETLASIAECLERFSWSDEDPPANPFIASISGGFAAHTADVMARLGMPLQDPTPAGVAALTALPTASHPVNPYDIAAKNPLIPSIIDIFREDGFNQLLFGLVMLKTEINEQITEVLIEAKRQGMDRLFVLSPNLNREHQKRFNDAGIILTDNALALLKALKAIEAHRRAAVLRKARPAAEAPPEFALPLTPGLVDEARSKALVATLGIRAPQSVVLPAEGPIGGYGHLKYPLVLKGVSDKIAHKSEHGLVAVGLRTDADVAEAWRRVTKALAKADPEANSILIEEMIGTGLEAILGVQRDAAIGPVVVLGAGGVLVELLDDAVVLAPPFSVEEAKAAIVSTRFGRLLTGFRGRRYDIEALAKAAAMLGQVALANPTLESIDLNPVLVQPDDGGIIAVDSKILIGP